MANLFKVTCAKFYKNLSSFVEDYQNNFDVFFMGHSVVYTTTRIVGWEMKVSYVCVLCKC